MHWSNENKTELRELVKRKLSWAEIADHFPGHSQDACQAQANKLQINSPERARPKGNVGRPKNRRKSVPLHMRLDRDVADAFTEAAAQLNKKPGKLLALALVLTTAETGLERESVMDALRVLPGRKVRGKEQVPVCWSVPAVLLRMARKRSGLTAPQTGVAALRALLTAAGYTLESL